MESNNLAEEVFCLKYELNTLADQLIRKSSERWVPGFLFDLTEDSHLQRYKLACKYSANKKVIDIACGVGKGSNLVATDGGAASVYGADIQPDAIRYAKWRYGAGNITFEVNNAQALNITDEFDMAVSFETVEHLPDYRAFLINLKNSLKKDGAILISTPISSKPFDPKPGNPYHVQEWGFKQFQDILSEFFTIEKVYVQLYPKIHVYEPVQLSLQQRIINKVKNKLFGKQTQVITNDNLPESKFSKIEEYTNQYPADELGTTRLGYQIVFGKVNE